MESLKKFLLGKRVYLDVNVFIYALEPNENMQQHFEISSLIFGMADNGELDLVTSELTLAEALVGAFENQELVDLYELVLTNSPKLEVLPVDKSTLKQAAFLRHKNKTALADAIHVATALSRGVDAFITNDKALKMYDGLEKIYMADWVDKS